MEHGIQAPISAQAERERIEEEKFQTIKEEYYDRLDRAAQEAFDAAQEEAPEGEPETDAPTRLT